MHWIHSETYYQALTIFVELVFLYAARLAFGLLGGRWVEYLDRRFFLAVFAANLISHPIAWTLFYGSILPHPEWRWLMLGLVEVGVALTEASIVHFGARIPFAVALVMSLVANGLTTLIGILI